MKIRHSPRLIIVLVTLGIIVNCGFTVAQTPTQFSVFQLLTNREAMFRLNAPTGSRYLIESSTNLINWRPLVTFANGGANSFTDTAAPFNASRFYRASQTTATNAVTGDILETDDGEVAIRPINHATFVISWKGKFIYFDPVGGAARFSSIPRADLIFITHGHGDHYDASTITSVKATNCTIIAPASVQVSLPAGLKPSSQPMANGETLTIMDIQVEAVPMYNFSNSNHPKGVGNGYLLTIGGRRIYVGGDTEDTPEMRALRNIDVAFVPMNLPYTMSVNKAAEAVRLIRPKVVYPYHYQGSNVSTFKQLVGSDLGIEVRLRTWY